MRLKSESVQQFMKESAPGNIRQSRQVEACNDAISLSRPLGKDESLRTLSTDFRTEVGKDQKGKSGGKGVYNKALNTGDGTDLRICEENSRS